MQQTLRTQRPPRPEDFGDYRRFLEARVEYLKSGDRSFSFRKLARKGGLSSPGLLHDILQGRRELAPSAIEKVAKALGLGIQETDAFEAPVLLGRAKSDEERNRHFARLRRKSRPGHPAEMGNAQYDVYSLWYALPIRELMLLPEFNEDPAWIARRLRPRIRPAEARKALDLLEQVGLAVRDEEGRLRPADTTITTPPTVASLAARNYHRNMLRLSAESLEEVPQERRNITSLNVVLSRKQYERLAARIHEFQDEILALAEEELEKGEKREVFWIGFDVVPLSEEEEG